MAKGVVRRKVRKARRRLTDQEKRQRRHARTVRSIFEGAGFTRVEKVDGLHFDFEKARTEFDDCFFWKNVVVFLEYTTDKDISGHFKKKAYNYQEFIDKASNFVNFIWEKYPGLDPTAAYDVSQIEVRFVYSHIDEVSSDLLDRMKHVSVLDELNTKYFSTLVKTIRHSAANELLEFLDVPFERAGDAVTAASTSTLKYPAQLVPSSATYLGAEHVVVTFYARPEDLLKMSYVLRRQGWRDEDYLFQRMIDKRKVDSIRDHLLSKSRVFLNNIVVALPENTVLRDANLKGMDTQSFSKLENGWIELPSEFNCIGIIDGQHRVFSYHAGGKKDEKVAVLRQRQDLLVTGVVFPNGISDADRLKTQAEIFLEINSKQTSANNDLIQDLSVVISPYEEISISRQVLRMLNSTGALRSKFARMTGDAGRLKTTSIVSYGLRQLLKFEGNDTLFKNWADPGKELLVSGKRGAPLEEYIKYSSELISQTFSSVKYNVDKNWTVKSKDNNGILSTTFVNGILVLMRHMVENNENFDREEMQQRFSKFSDFPFDDYKSSQYGSMGRKLYELVSGEN